MKDRRRIDAYHLYDSTTSELLNKPWLIDELIPALEECQNSVYTLSVFILLRRLTVLLDRYYYPVQTTPRQTVVRMEGVTGGGD